MRYSIILVILLALVGCKSGCNEVKSQKNIVNITLENVSTNALAWVKLNWEGPYVPGGILSPGISSTAISVNWPNLPDAKITFIDRITRKPYEIKVSFVSINERMKSGRYHDVKIQILDFDKANVELN